MAFSSLTFTAIRTPSSEPRLQVKLDARKLLFHHGWAFGSNWGARISQLWLFFFILVVLLSISRVICGLNTVKLGY